MTKEYEKLKFNSTGIYDKKQMIELLFAIQKFIGKTKGNKFSFKITVNEK